jgi:hypothetical protein
MSAFSNEGAKLVLDHLTGNAEYEPPAALYLALHDSGGSSAVDPGEAQATIAGTEMDYTSYARQTLSLGAATATDPPTTSNDAVVTFPAVDSGDGPVTATGFSIWDAATGGNCLFHGALTAARELQDTDSLIFNTGELDVALD